MHKKVQRFQITFPRQGIVMICCLVLLSSYPSLAISEEKLEVVQEEDLNKVLERHEEKDWTTLFEDQIKQWVSDISTQEPRFQNWAKAEWESYPFGPGSKQWMIILIEDEQEIGYLIMGVDSSDQFILIEYGQSQEGVLSQTVQDNPGQDHSGQDKSNQDIAEHFFYHGLLWAHIQEGVLVDAFTKERYEHIALEKVQPFWSGEAVQRIQQVFDTESEAHEENPIVHYSGGSRDDNHMSIEKDLSRDTEVITKLIQKTKKNQPLFYQAEILPQVRGLYEVESIHQWVSLNENHEPTESFYIGFLDGGVRFFSYDYLQKMNGSFYE